MANRIFGAVLLAGLLAVPSLGFADSAADLAEMQKKLNQEVMEAPFDANIEMKATKEIDALVKQGAKPKSPYWGNLWQPGWNSCNHLYKYGYNYYRDCRYHRRYHGRFY